MSGQQCVRGMSRSIVISLFPFPVLPNRFHELVKLPNLLVYAQPIRTSSHVITRKVRQRELTVHLAQFSLVELHVRPRVPLEFLGIELPFCQETHLKSNQPSRQLGVEERLARVNQGNEKRKSETHNMYRILHISMSSEFILHVLIP